MQQPSKINQHTSTKKAHISSHDMYFFIECVGKEFQTPIYHFSWEKKAATPPKFNSSPLQNGGWKTIRLPIGAKGNFSGVNSLLNFGRIPNHSPLRCWKRLPGGLTFPWVNFAKVHLEDRVCDECTPEYITKDLYSLPSCSSLFVGGVGGFYV